MEDKMIEMWLLVPSLVYIALFAASFNTRSANLLKRTSNLVGLISLSGILVAGYLYWSSGNTIITLFQTNATDFSIRIDAISLVMYSMVSLIAYFVYRFSLNYMDGDPYFRRFAGLFSLIVGSVQMLVITNNLAAFFFFWVATSFGLHQLMKLNPNRKKAVRAARAKFIMARAADATLLGAFVLIYSATGTDNLQKLLFDATTLLALQDSGNLLGITSLLALTAIFKSVQFPFHTWIFGVLECPTPISALLHAGLLNAGPFLIIRFSPLFAGMEFSSSLLLIVGGISAIFGSTVYITQSSVKTGLVFSSIGHMGFSLMLCGLGLYPAALVHLVSHSFYKAHAFLSSGSVIEDVKIYNPKNYTRIGNPINILIALFISLFIYSLASFAVIYYFHISSAIIFVGGTILLGLFTLLTYTIDSNNYLRTTVKVLSAALLVTVVFFLLEEGAGLFLANEVPVLSELGGGRLIASVVVALLFVVTAIFQLFILTPKYSHTATALRVHLRNGLYIDSLYRKIGRGKAY